MSEVTSLNNLIQAGMTREEFLARYKQIAEETRNEPARSIFFGMTQDDAISRMFDVIQTTNDDGDNCDNAKISQSDIDRLAAFDGDNTSISEEDLMKRLEEILTQNPVVAGPVDSDSPSIPPAQGLDILFDLKNLKSGIATNRKNQLQSEIDELTSQSTKDNPEYKSLKSSIDSKTKELESKKKELEEVKRNIQITQAEIAKKQAKARTIEDEAEKQSLTRNIEELQRTLDGYNTTATQLSNEISSLGSSLKNLKDSMKKLISKLEKEHAAEIKKKQDEMDAIDNELAQDMAVIDNQIQAHQETLIQQAQQAGADSARYTNMGNDGHIGKTAAQALSNAAGEIGVREATGNNDGAQIAKYRNGVDNNAAWCASFVSWCYKGNDVFGYQASVSGIQMAAQQKGLYSEVGSYTPKPGDVMIQKNGVSHTGIVESVDPDGTIHTIEGNSSNSVRRVTYRPGSRGYNHISGFVRMSEQG